MPLREDLLSPIAGDNPSGADVRYDSKLLIYDRIKEARREDDNLAQGDWQHNRKVADYPLVVNLTQEALATHTKDLQLAVWLAEAMLHTEGFAGLRKGLVLCQELISRFWETIYPPIEDGDKDLRAAPLDWMGSTFGIPLKNARLVQSGYDWFKFKESRMVGYEEQAQTDKEKKVREKLLKEGKLAPELFDKAFVATPKVFYLQMERDLDGCIDALRTLDKTSEEKFGDSAPSLSKLKISLEEVRQTVHSLLEKKRETEPDPVEEKATNIGEEQQHAGASADATSSVALSSAAPGITISVLTSSEPADRRDAIASIAKAAAFLRKREPYSPAPYLMMRGLRWGELRSAVRASDASLLEAPPTELRQQLKRLALGKQWKELLETAETAMSLPCSRGWLDLQRFVAEACIALGKEYEPIGSAIRSELLVLIKDMPELLDANLLDDTPAANSETRAWLLKLGEVPSTVPEHETSAAASNGSNPPPSWPTKANDAYGLAQEALKSGQPEKALEIMHREIARQSSGRGRFERNLQLVRLCVSAGKDTIAQPLLDDIAAAIETHKLDDWEDKQMVADALITLMTVSKKVQGNAAEKQKLFERICRLDPVRALSAG